VSRAESLAAKASRLRELNASTSVGTDVRPNTGTEVRALSPRTKPVRLTVDVAPADHAALRRLCIDLAAELGVAQVSGQDVLRALLRRALVDDEARAQLARDLSMSVRQ
jgi:hypothetical protein